MLTLALLLMLVSCDQSNSVKQALICGDTISYWDANVGFGKAFACDGTCYEYSYNDQGKRERVDYGDVIIDHFAWRVTGKRLSIEVGNYRRNYTIVRLNKTQLVVTDSTQELGTNQIIFTKALK